MNFEEKDETYLNQTVLFSLKMRIYELEKENNKTKKLTNNQMTDKIRHLIERAAENDN
ncbi:MAG: hypothetical protein RBQ97_08255 [Acholeplasma sp.]|jgi:hypothetical protein|uniref:hypothetical protein n=1 Tax=unclassified Acetobacterium TaxID=2638182 RepID=UPI0013A69A2F|nr:MULTISPECIES: hypothetical protein [unclassified Acetobacterium]MDY0278062.1 hypothetical protein [Acholeplasma sp.]MDZ5726608.1 hypothetical protein [Acetobacterium sp. K1/6]